MDHDTPKRRHQSYIVRPQTTDNQPNFSFISTDELSNVFAIEESAKGNTIEFGESRRSINSIDQMASVKSYYGSDKNTMVIYTENEIPEIDDTPVKNDYRASIGNSSFITTREEDESCDRSKRNSDFDNGVRQNTDRCVSVENEVCVSYTQASNRPFEDAYSFEASQRTISDVVCEDLAENTKMEIITQNKLDSSDEIEDLQQSPTFVGEYV